MSSLLLYISVYLLTCAPGEPLYARYGHTALRVVDEENPQWDYVFNYGIFSFETEGFYRKFVQGQTYYQLGVQRTCDFMEEYAYYHRAVYAQKLNLTPEQSDQLAQALVVNYQPENRYYLYNFVFDNCATRPYVLIKKVVGDLHSSYHGWEGQTYRRFIQYYTGKNSVIDFLINMIFGTRANETMHGEQRLFLPEELMFYISQATMADGTPLVKEQTIQPFIPAPVQWYNHIYFYLILFACVMLALSLYDRKRNKRTRLVDNILITLYVLTLGLVIFLRFFSIHPLVGFNYRLLIFPLIHLCTRLLYIFR